MAQNVSNDVVTLDSQSQAMNDLLGESTDSKVLSVFEGRSSVDSQKPFAQKQELQVMDLIKQITSGENPELKETIKSIIIELKQEFKDSVEPMSEEDFFMAAVSTYCEYVNEMDEN